MFRSLLAMSAALISISAAELASYRLPGDLSPHHYNLSLLTDLDSFIFTGQVDIEINCNVATDTVKLHSVDLTVDDSSVTLRRASDNSEVKVTGISLDTDNDFLIIKLKEKLVPNSAYLLHIGFHGNLTDSLAGYYRSSYKDRATNTTKWLASTQFEPTDARRAFPCFDEPAMKAKFRIRLGHREHLKSASNMPLDKTIPVEGRAGWVWSEYQDSVPMSTYLVAFVVSEFEFRQSEPQPNNVIFRVWARHDAIDQVEFARQYGPRFLNFFEDFFQVKYPLPKQDMVAIPDFSTGAMENWGLIMYRESQLLYDEKTTSVMYKCNIADTIAHELAHQWFGNLVTMRWWTDLWLNEGFATYVASLAIHHQFPEWNSYNGDVTSNLLDVFHLDSLQSSHPVSVPIGHPDEILQIFDSISYSKGSLLLHMMTSFLGKDNFRAGVTEYLRKYAYGNSEQNDLWESLTAAANRSGVLPPGVTVRQLMDSWTLQTGYPVLRVERANGTLTISQKRFLAIRPKPGDQVQGCWWVPLTFYTASNRNYAETRASHWLSCQQELVNFDTSASADDWIILNNQAASIYRVNYDPHTWSQLAATLRGPHFGAIHELNRVQLVLDAMALARVGELDYTLAFRLLKYVRNETAYNPWRAATSSLNDLEYILWRTEKFPDFKKLVQSLMGEVYTRFSDLTTMPQAVEESRHKVMILGMACVYQVGDCASHAARLFKAWMTSDVNPIPKDLRNIVYCEGLRQGGEAEWDFVWQKYRTSESASEKSTFLRVLACTEQEPLLKRYLEWSIDPSSEVRRQNSGTVFNRVSAHTKQGFKVALAFLEDNIQRIHDYLAPNTVDLGDYVKVLSDRLVTPEEVEKMKKFVTTNKKLLDKSQLLVKQGLETAEANLEWMRNFYDKISDAFAA